MTCAGIKNHFLAQTERASVGFRSVHSHQQGTFPLTVSFGNGKTLLPNERCVSTPWAEPLSTSRQTQLGWELPSLAAHFNTNTTPSFQCHFHSWPESTSFLLPEVIFRSTTTNHRENPPSSRQLVSLPSAASLTPDKAVSPEIAHGPRMTT